MFQCVVYIKLLHREFPSFMGFMGFVGVWIGIGIWVIKLMGAWVCEWGTIDICKLIPTQCHRISGFMIFNYSNALSIKH